MYSSLLQLCECYIKLQVTQLTAQLQDVVSSANEASDLMENEQMEKRELEEKLNESNVSLNYTCTTHAFQIDTHSCMCIDEQLVHTRTASTRLPVLSPDKIESMVDGHGLGGAYSHFKIYSAPPPIPPHQRF